jgi:hypothetical protein
MKKNIKNFNGFDGQKSVSEGLEETGAKMRRIVTGQSAGDELNKLPKDVQQKIVDLYRKDPMEAAKYLRSIIIKEKNSQFGLGAALALAGAAMIIKSFPPKPDSDGHWADVKPGDGETQFLNNEFGTKLSPDSTFAEFKSAVASKLGNGDYAEGVKNLFAGVKGPQHDVMVDRLLGLNDTNPSSLLKDVFTGDLAPHGALDWGSSGVKVWVPD